MLMKQIVDNDVSEDSPKVLSGWETLTPTGWDTNPSKSLENFRILY